VHSAGSVDRSGPVYSSTSHKSVVLSDLVLPVDLRW